MIIIGVDPGPVKSGMVVCNELSLFRAEEIENDIFLRQIKNTMHDPSTCVAIEDITSYGAAIGKETIETAVFIGRLIEAAESTRLPTFRYKRREYGMWTTDGKTCTDKAIRASLESTYGGYKKGEPLFKLKSGSHARSAFAVAKYHEHVMTQRV